jgi:hypothetical protein
MQAAQASDVWAQFCMPFTLAGKYAITLLVFFARSTRKLSSISLAAVNVLGRNAQKGALQYTKCAAAAEGELATLVVSKPSYCYN